VEKGRMHCPSDNPRIAIQYSVGKVEGDLCTDTATIAGLSIKNQNIVLIDSAAQLYDRAFDGVLGLAFPALSHMGDATEHPTVLKELALQFSITVFSFLLTGNEHGNRLVFGLPREEWFHESAVTYSPVVLQGWWTLEGSLIVGDTILVEHSYFALDTGTSYLTMPPKLFDTFLDLILPKHAESCFFNPLLNAFECKCDHQDAKVVYLNVNGTDFPIYPEDLGIQDGSGGTCVLDLQRSSDELPIIMGDVFLRSIASIYDVGNLRIGLLERPDHRPASESTRLKLAYDKSAKRKGPLLPPHQLMPWFLHPWLAIAIPMIFGSLFGACFGWLISDPMLRLMACVRRTWKKLRGKSAVQPAAASAREHPEANYHRFDGEVVTDAHIGVGPA